MVWAAGRCDPQGPGLTGGGEPAYPSITEVPLANRGAAQRAIASPAGQPSVADLPKDATGGREGSREDRLHLPHERGLVHTGKDMLNGFELALEEAGRQAGGREIEVISPPSPRPPARVEVSVAGPIPPGEASGLRHAPGNRVFQ